MVKFKLVSEFRPRGDQPAAIENITAALKKGARHQVLLGVTGSGKTFTMANIIAALNRPVIVISHNKTLAAQLYSEFKDFFPSNAVEYFVSYYDYYQPEAYIPQTDTYIEKDSSINDQIDRLRLKAASSLLSRRDVIIVASVSCIYGIGSKEEWRESMVNLTLGKAYRRQDLLRDIVHLQYERNDLELSRGRFRAKGEMVEIFPAYLETAYRINFSSDVVEKITQFDPVSRNILAVLDRLSIYPAKHFIISQPKMKTAMRAIRKELSLRLAQLRSKGKLLEAQRLESRTNYDIEMMLETGYCHGIENYSRHLSGRPAGSPPECLLNYFPEDYMTIIDESHVTIPQLVGMYNADRSRKQTLVDFGFRLPSALDNRPLKFEEFERLVNQTVYVSATPAPYELRAAGGAVVEQIIRPTGLVDPEIVIRPVRDQIEDLIREIEVRASKKERVLVTTLTKRMAEDLCEYLMGKGMRVRYLHSDIDTLERVEILQSLRKGDFDVLVGINLLREGLDLPEVSLVAVLDADKEGFLRSRTSLIQVCGRAARNVYGKVIMYADSITGSMREAVGEMTRRRIMQLSYNTEHRITPRTVKKSIKEVNELRSRERAKAYELIKEKGYAGMPEGVNLEMFVRDLKEQMNKAAQDLEFELAAILRDRIYELEAGTPLKSRKENKLKKRAVS